MAETPNVAAEAWARICANSGLRQRTTKVGSEFTWQDFADLAEAAIGLALHERAKFGRENAALTSRVEALETEIERRGETLQDHIRFLNEAEADRDVARRERDEARSDLSRLTEENQRLRATMRQYRQCSLTERLAESERQATEAIARTTLTPSTKEENSDA